MPELRYTQKPKAIPIPAARPKPPAIANHAVASGSGTLDTKTQREMGSRFGHDFSQVRIHTDTRAAESAQSLGAIAYAVGSDIVFGPGRYTPGTRDGDRLLAHELTHVVQQAKYGAGDPSRASRRGDASEQEAEALASQVLEGQAVQVRSAPSAAIARVPDNGPSVGPYIPPAPEPEYEGSADQARNSMIWDGLGTLPVIGNVTSGISTVMDLGSAAYHGVTGQGDKAAKDLKNAALDTLGMIPIAGNVLSAEEAAVDANAWRQRSAGASGADAPTFSDMWVQGMPTMKDITSPFTDPDSWTPQGPSQ